MLFAIGVVSLFITGGLTGIILADSALDVNLHNTYFVVAHFHIVMGVASMFGTFAGVYHWYPKLFGRMMNNKLGYIHFWVTLTSAYGVFFPMHYLGLAGVPRRYYNYTAFEMFNGFADLNTIISIFAIVGVLVQFVFVFNFIYSALKGPKAPQNPWQSTTLEWTTPVEHLHGNWPGEIPAVHRWPYDYSLPDKESDFIPQTEPLAANEKEHAH
jgi:cytochrome c oxidase subunit 1